MLDRALPCSPEDWLQRAQSSLEIAKYPMESASVFADDLCYQAQQAVEKALKAVFVKRNWKLRYTHDIRELIVGLRHQGLSVPKEIDGAARLTKYAVEARYPNFIELATKDDLAEAIRLAEIVVEWVANQLSASQP